MKLGPLQKKEHAMLLTKLHDQIFKEFMASGTTQCSPLLLGILTKMNIKKLKFHLGINDK